VIPAPEASTSHRRRCLRAGDPLPGGSGASAQDHQQILRIHLLAGSDEHLRHLAVRLGAYGSFHLHRLEGGEQIAARHLAACCHGDRRDGPGHLCPDLSGIAGLRLALRRALGDLTAVGHAHGARLAVELEENGPGAVLVRLAGGHVAHDQRLPALQLDADFLTRLHSVEEHRARQNADIAVLRALGGIVQPYPGIHQIRGEVVIGNRTRYLLLDLGALGCKVDRGHLCARASRQWDRALQHLALQRKVLKGAVPLTRRPGAEMPAVDLAAERAKIQQKVPRPVTDDDLASYLMYPRVWLDYAAERAQYGDVSILPSAVFFYGMEPGQEVSVELERGKTLIVRYVASSETHEDGTRTVFFELNGQPRSVRVPDRSQVAKRPPQRKADPGNPRQVGAPMPGTVATIAVTVGRKVARGDLLATLEAMKMETAVRAEADGEVAEVL